MINLDCKYNSAMACSIWNEELQQYKSFTLYVSKKV